jgi:citrate lyase subunit beta / citryl-CoA lyase
VPAQRQRLREARSLLFVPGSRPDRFDKAAAAGADLVVLDLEDAVRPEEKALALDHVGEWLVRGRPAVVRINALGTPWHEAEVSAVTRWGCGVMVPKAEHAAGLVRLGERCPGGLIALVETARGVQSVDAVAATPGVERLALGTVDLAAELGVDPASSPALAYSRGRLVIASAAAGIAAPIDGVTTALGDVDSLASDTRAARALGFAGKLCIHPRQVQVVHEELRPGVDEIRWAERIIAESSIGGVAVVDGAMVDAPVVARAHAILSRADLL